nr:S41 family peptidase [Entomospira culicis]
MPRLEGLLAQYRQAMEHLPYWIIDLRGNGGGSDRIWSHFWPYLSSGVLLQGGTAFRASRGNQGYFTLAAHYAKLWGAHNDSLWYESVVKAMRVQSGNFVIPPLPGFSPEIHLQQPRPYPQRVAILIDNKTASSAETLVHLAKQSFKVIVLGQSPSMGCTDSGNLRYAILPSKRYALSFGTSLELNSYHVAIDRGGYQPDIILPQGDPALVIPWAQAYLRNDLNQIRAIYTQFSSR